jgi:hypothetical protein
LNKLYDISLEEYLTLNKEEKDILIDIGAEVFIQEVSLNMVLIPEGEEQKFWSECMHTLEKRIEQMQNEEKYEACAYFNEVKWRIIKKMGQKNV